MPIFVKHPKIDTRSLDIYQRKKPQVQTTPNTLEVHQATVIFLSVGGREFHRIYLYTNGRFYVTCRYLDIPVPWMRKG